MKSLYRERILHHGGVQKFPPKIRRLKLDTKINKKINGPIYSILITLAQDRMKVNFSVGRLVYNAFVASFDLQDPNIIISYKDGDGRNLDYRNLLMTTIKQLRQLSFDQGRSASHFSIFSKPVSQFTTDEKLIKQYASIYQAAKETGFKVTAISGVANGRKFLCGGFAWQFGKRKTLIPGNLPAKSASAPVNTTLMIRLGIESSKKPIPAVLDLSLKNRPGERWKDIPGYEGLYKISNQGRVKALKKVSEGKHQKWFRETIKKPNVEVLNIISKSKKLGSPTVILSKNLNKKRYRISRLVYYLFVKPFPIENPLIRVYCKDGNQLNVAPDNLELRTAESSFSVNRMLK